MELNYESFYIPAISNEREIFGEVVNNKVFIDAFKEIYEKIRRDGSKETLAWLTKKN